MTLEISKYIKNTDGHYVCPHCNVVKAKQNTMLYHIQSKHTKQFAYKCDRCTGDNIPQFLQRCGYLHHLATVHPENPHLTDTEKNPYAETLYNCPEKGCDHSTHTRGNLVIHVVRNHLKAYIPAFEKTTACTSCSKQFQSSGAYLYHAPTCFSNVIPDTYKSMLSLSK